MIYFPESYALFALFLSCYLPGIGKATPSHLTPT